MERAYEKFLRYIKYDTRADHDSMTSPSTEKQHRLAEQLERELIDLGLCDVRRTAEGYVYGKLPASKGAENCDTVGLVAHIDTSPDMSDENVNARIIKGYDGGCIELDTEGKFVLDPARFEELKTHIGEDLIVTDGSTLLGADDKAGIAEIIAALETVIADNLPHRAVSVCFTTDEEVGRGVDHFDVEGFGARYAYTVDGGALDVYAVETFNAASAVVIVQGENIHPGSAKNKMKNAVLMAMEFNALLPENERPDKTEGREGFYHLGGIEGIEQKCVMRYIIRDHDAAILDKRKHVMWDAANKMCAKYGEDSVTVLIKDSYRNMGEVLKDYPMVTERLVSAMKKAGIAEPKAVPTRGGTDGARLSFLGLPCPNMPTGGHNCHGRYEYVSIQAMDSVVKMLIALTEPD